MLPSLLRIALLCSLTGLVAGCSSADPPAATGAPSPEASHEHQPERQKHGTETTEHPAMHHRFNDATKWAKVFDDPARDEWQRPKALIAALEIPVGASVADIGAGTGYFNRHLSRVVGPDGIVLAVDIEPSLIGHMKERAAVEGTANVRARLGAAEDPGLARGEVDLILLVDTYHHIDDRHRYFSALRASLRSGGRLVVVDFKPGELPVGPPPEHRIAEEQVEAELKAAGWDRSPFADLLPYQFAAVFTVRTPNP